MRKNLSKKVVGLTLTTAMIASLTACNSSTSNDPTQPSTKGTDTETTSQAEQQSETTTEETTTEEETTLYTDANGNVVDLGGMEIYIRDWWSTPIDGEDAEPNNKYEEARQDYLEWAQETYNFKIRQVGISSWDSTPEDFLNYASSDPDDMNYLFILRSGKELASALSAGLMYDLSTLDCLDFSEAKWANGVDKQYTIGGKTYCMSGDSIEPKGGMYFNKRLLSEAGIEPQSIYDLQESGDWTWDKFEEICKQIAKDTDNDGVIDRFAMVNFASTFIQEAVWSNNAEFIGKDADGKFINKLETNETLEALNWAVDMLAKYDYPQPDGAEWNYWQEAFVNGAGAFIAGETYQAGQDWKDMEDDFGFVCFPKGPNATDYTNCYNDNPIVIPANYDADRAWKIAFAYNVWTDPVPGFEDYNGRIEGFYNSFRDTESVDLTIARLYQNGMTTYHLIVPGLDLGPDLIWGLGTDGDSTPAAKAEAIRDTWQSYLDELNNK